MARVALVSLSLIALISVSGMSWAGETISGQATVIDGDTLRLRGRVIGLHGIAAPGKSQTCLDDKGRDYACGQVSAQALTSKLSHAAVVCEVGPKDKYGRTTAICRKSNTDLSAWLVRSGYAVADRRAQPDYLAEETRAWGKRRNLWAGVFEDPLRRKREIAPQPAAVADVQP